MEAYKAYPYRWVILISVMPILAAVQIFWLTLAPISDIAASYYHVSSLGIAFVSMSYMIVYIFVTVPASMLVDKRGFRAAFIVGSVIIGIFGLMRGFCYSNFTLVVIAQLGVAVAQPFLVNAITKLAATWFPVEERATASGIANMAGYLGMIIAMIATPALAPKAAGIGSMMKIYAVISLASALVAIVFLREKPKTPAGPGGEVLVDYHVKDIAGILKNRNFLVLMGMMFVALGVFNALMTCVGDFLTPRGITADQAGLIGGIIVLVGLVGAVIIPIFSDKLRMRRNVMIVSLAVALPGIAGLAFLPNYGLLLASAALAGFFIMGVGPVAFQYGAEIAYPLPEGTSYGLLMVAGQVSGILFIVFLELCQKTLALSVLTALMVACFILSFRLKESKIIIAADAVQPPETAKR
ncbi:MAG: MFS transporter [Clostridia bacterium]|nr:MFS transporter [Clostridia bacterium]MDR3644939.1 MFS transporter [Clostridia bacterium]